MLHVIEDYGPLVLGHVIMYHMQLAHNRNKHVPWLDFADHQHPHYLHRRFVPLALPAQTISTKKKTFSASLLQKLLLSFAIQAIFVSPEMFFANQIHI